MPLPDQADVEAVLDALRAELEAMDYPMEITLRPESAFRLAALIQLALRHPGVGPEIRTFGTEVLDATREYFAHQPTVLAMLRHGDDPHYDCPGTVQ